MTRATRKQFHLDVRTKLLALLALLSLPLLIVSFLQLNSYRDSLVEQSTALARIETNAAEGALDSWLEAHPQAARAGASLAPGAAADPMPSCGNKRRPAQTLRSSCATHTARSCRTRPHLRRLRASPMSQLKLASSNGATARRASRPRARSVVTVGASRLACRSPSTRPLGVRS